MEGEISGSKCFQHGNKSFQFSSTSLQCNETIKKMNAVRLSQCANTGVSGQNE